MAENWARNGPIKRFGSLDATNSSLSVIARQAQWDRLRELNPGRGDVARCCGKVVWRGLPPEPEQRRNVERIVALRKWPWPVLWNPRGHLQHIAGKWSFNTVPAWILIGRDGRLVLDRSAPFPVTIPRELARSRATGGNP